VPDKGLLDPSTVTAGILRGTHPAPWDVAHASICQITFEVEREAALSFLPGEVSRPVPCYARLFVLDAEDGPAGALKLAALMVGGRYRMLPRNVLAAGVVDGPANAVAAAFGAPFATGRISVERAGSTLTAEVREAGELVATVVLPDLRAVDPAMLRWDPWLGFAGPGDNIDLVEYSPRPQLTGAFLSKGATLDTPSSLSHDYVWRRLRNLNTISACYAEGSLTLTAPEPQEALV
jgi:hypothetical protein